MTTHDEMDALAAGMTAVVRQGNVTPAHRVIGTDAAGRRIEYRIDWYAPGFYRIDARVLQAGDVPFDDRWYPIEDSHLVTLSRARGEAGNGLADVLTGLGL